MEKLEVERIVPSQIDKCLVDTYQEHLARYIFADNFVKSGCIGLDIACGSGYGTDILVRSGKAAKFFGIDISPEAIEYAKNNFTNPKLNFIIADAINFNHEQYQFDLITSFETIEHFDEDQGKKFLKTMYSLLKSNGILILSCPNKDTYPENHTPNRFHLHEYSFREINMLVKTVFPNVEIYCQHMLYFNRFYKKVTQFLRHLPHVFIDFLVSLAKRKHMVSPDLRNINPFYRMLLYRYHFKNDVYSYVENYAWYKPGYFTFVCRK